MTLGLLTDEGTPTVAAMQTRQVLQDSTLKSPLPATSSLMPKLTPN